MAQPEVSWYFVHNGEVKGPVGQPEIIQLYEEGVVQDQTPVWNPGQTEWQELCKVEELVNATEEPPAKRSRQEPIDEPERQELPQEFSLWVAELDEESLAQLLYVALYWYRPEVIQGLPAARDALLASFIQRFPACQDPDPSHYQFSDDFLCDSVEDVTDKEDMWKLMGQGNEDAVRAVVRSAAELDDRYLGRVYAFWATGKARKLIYAKDLDGLLALIEEDPGLVMTRDMHGRTVLHSLAAAGEAQLLQRALERVPAMSSQVDSVDENLDAPLHLAVRAGDEGAVKALLGAGANPNLQNRDLSEYASGQWSVKSKDLDFKVPVPSQHHTPLHIAAEQGDQAVMCLLLGAGARLDVRDSAGSTALHLALEAEDLDVVKMLLDAGANPTLGNSEMGDDSTPLHYCCSQGQAQLAEALLATGRLDVNKPGPQGWYPLQLAVRRGSLPCVQLLLRHGADVNVANEQGKTPLDLALVNKRAQIAELLQGAGARASQT